MRATRLLGRAALTSLAAALSLSLLLSEAEGFIVGIPQDLGSLGMISSAARRIGLGGPRGVMMLAERGGRRGGRGASSFSGGGGRGGGGARGRGGGRGGKNSMDTQKRDARDGMSRREYDTAVSIGGSSAKPQQLKKFLALAQDEDYGALEYELEMAGVSKNQVKRGIKAARKLNADSAAPPPLLDPSLSQLKCVHFATCSGCVAEADLLGVSTVRKARQVFDDALGWEGRFQVHMGSVHDWRTQAKLAVGPAPGGKRMEIGLYKGGTHEVLPIPNCRVHHPRINEAVAAIQQEAEDLRIRAYDEATGNGELRYIQASVERFSGKVQLTLVWNDVGIKRATGAQLLIKVLKARHSDLFHSIWVNFRTGSGNAILSRDDRDWLLAYGSEYVTERVGVGADLTFPLSPRMFRQGNFDQFAEIIKRIEEYIPEGSKVTELYAGGGVIGMSACLHKCQWIRLSDENPANVAAFLRLKGRLEPALKKKCNYIGASAEDAIDRGQLEGADVLIVDPPRKGLGPVAGFLADRNNHSLKRLVYVSCGFDALQGDHALLVKGGWKLKHAEGHVLFPGSDHIETLAIYDAP